jgi:hypothetical protein
MKSAFILLLLATIAAASTAAASTCPDLAQRSAEIGGHEIYAHLIEKHKAVPGVPVELYSGRTLIWHGTTDSDGMFTIRQLTSRSYVLKVRGWGEASVRLNPKLDRTFGGQTPYWHLVLADGGCISWGMDTN